MLNVNVLSVVLVNVIMLSVVAPFTVLGKIVYSFEMLKLAKKIK
jgi:hypothetical protein